MIRIVHLITELDVGGAQQALLRLLANADRSRYDITVLTLYNGDKPLGKAIAALDIPVIDLGLDKPWRLYAVIRLYAELRRRQPAILHAWMFHANILGRLVGRAAGVPSIITSRRSVEVGGDRREWIKRLTQSLDDAVIAVSDVVAVAEVERAGAKQDKVITVHNGLDVAEFKAEASPTMREGLGLGADDLVVGTVGRLQPVKAHQSLLAMVAELAPRWPQLRLVIVGDGPLRSDLEQLVMTYNIRGHVHFTGTRRDVAAILPTFDLFVLPSRWEGLPNAVLEAMASARPVVATAVGGTPEVVVEGVTGLLVPVGDQAALNGAIERLLADKSRRTTMGEAGRKHVQDRFSVHFMVDKVQALYERLLRQQGK